jgi:chitinase
VVVPVLGDTVDEGDETFAFTLSNPSRGVLFRPDATAVIQNEDFAFFSINDAAALERDGESTTAVFTVSLSSPSSQTVIVEFASTDGTAASGVDYRVRLSTTTAAVSRWKEPTSCTPRVLISSKEGCSMFTTMCRINSS